MPMRALYAFLGGHVVVRAAELHADRLPVSRLSPSGTGPAQHRRPRGEHTTIHPTIPSPIIRMTAGPLRGTGKPASTSPASTPASFCGPASGLVPPSPPPPTLPSLPGSGGMGPLQAASAAAATTTNTAFDREPKRMAGKPRGSRDLAQALPRLPIPARENVFARGHSGRKSSPLMRCVPGSLPSQMLNIAWPKSLPGSVSAPPAALSNVVPWPGT